MSGSVHEAEDLVQETFLRAWKASASFQGRSSVRTWLYRIATNVCLTNLEGKPRRPLPAGLGTPDQLAGDALEQDHEIAWLEPVPDAAVVVAERDSIRLAFVAALQHLPGAPARGPDPARRAALVGRRGRRRPSTPRRPRSTPRCSARTRRWPSAASTEDTVSAGPELSADQQRLLERYVDAFWRKDIDQIVSMLRADAVWEMPPFTGWYVGADNIGALIGGQCPGGAHDMPMLRTTANGQPAFGLYMRQPAGHFEPFHLQVLDLDGDRVRHVGAFFTPELFPMFGLPGDAARRLRPAELTPAPGSHPRHPQPQ